MKKKDTWIMVAMAFILFVVVILLMVTLVKKVSIKEETKKKEEELTQSDKTKEKKLTGELEQAVLLGLIEPYDDYFISFDGQKNLDKLTDEEKLRFVERLDTVQKEKYQIDFTTGVSLDKVLAVLKIYFGPDITFTPVNLPCFLEDGEDYLIYDEKTKMYHANTDFHQHGAPPIYEVENFYVDSYKTIDQKEITYTLKVKKAFSNVNDFAYYASYQDFTNKTNLLFNLFTIYGKQAETDKQNFIAIQYEKMKGHFPVYSYTFKTTTTVNEAYLVKLVK